MTEIECAIGIEQLKKLPSLLNQRLKNVAFLDEKLKAFPALKTQPPQPGGNVHCYYQYPIFFDAAIAGIHRNLFVDALKAEIPSAILRETAPLISCGYVKPLYLAPLYQQKAAWAFTHQDNANSGVSYDQGICPVTEQMHFEKLFSIEYIRPGLTENDILDVVNAMEKIFNNINELK
jgi:dTDP-4-amino-4,6-dideoxygalactose transaminase